MNCWLNKVVREDGILFRICNCAEYFLVKAAEDDGGIVSEKRTAKNGNQTLELVVEDDGKCIRSSNDDEDDDDDDVEEDKDEDEEHPALTDSIPPPPVHRVTARMSIREQPTTPVWSEAEIDRLLAIPLPPPSPLSPWSSPLSQIPSPPLPVSPPLLVSSLPLPASPTYPLGYRAAMIQLRAETPSTSHPPPPIVLIHTRAYVAMLRADAPSTYILAPRSETPPSGTPPLLPIPLPTSLPHLLLPSTSHRVDVLKVTLPPRKRLCITLGPRYKVSESSSTAAARPTRGLIADYGFVAILDGEIRRDPERERMTNFITTIRHDTDEIYGRLDDAQDERALISERKMAPKRTTRSTSATTTTTTTTVTNAQLKALIDQGVSNALAARDADRSQNGEDSHDFGMGARRQAPPARECTYQDFMKCKPLYFKGAEGVVELTQWFERIETVFRISNCTVENQIKFATCTLLGSALTWWNSHVMTIGHDVAYAMTWTNLRKKMTDKYCPRGEIKNLKGELWNLRVKSNDVVGYNQRFQELALLCVRMFPEESDKVERYVGGLSDMIHDVKRMKLTFRVVLVDQRTND
nr:hypothetical protein [Tanacetum cinerariifolium]